VLPVTVAFFQNGDLGKSSLSSRNASAASGLTSRQKIETLSLGKFLGCLVMQSTQVMKISQIDKAIYERGKERKVRQ